MDRKTEAEPRRGGEFVVAACVFALPPLYLITERSSEIVLWRYSLLGLLWIAIAALFYAAWLASYWRTWPSWLAVLRKLCVALAASLLLAALAGEALLRATDDARYTSLPNTGRHAFDPDVGHVYLPNYEQIIQTAEFSTHWRSNAQGLRADHDFGPKPAGLLRVLVVGDSFTVGDQVEFPETYPSVMQQQFDALYGPGQVEVLNAGFPGFGTIHERKWIEKFACALQPDLIVVGSTPNDLLENQFPLLYEARDGALVSHGATLGDQQRFESHKHWYSLPGWVERSKVKGKLDLLHIVDRLRGRAGSPHRRAFQVKQDKDSIRLYTLYEKEIELAQAAAGKCNAKFAVLAIPFLEQLRVPGPNQDFSLWGKRLTEIAARHAFPVVDLLPDFLAAGDPEALYWRGDSHCRAAGYRLIGVTASSALSTLGAEVNLTARAR